MVTLLRSEVVDCSNPKLDIYLTTGPGGPLVDPFILEYTISDNTGGSPVQVFPATGRATVDLADCPTGEKLGTGHYVALWTVPDTEPLGSHLLCWFFKASSGSPENTSQEDFDVAAITGAPDFDNVTVATFRIRFPQFASVSSELIQVVIDEACRRIGDGTCFGTRLTDAKHYLAAHLLELAGAARGAGKASVSAGAASVSYITQTAGPESYDITGYGRLYRDLFRMCGPAARVLC